MTSAKADGGSAIVIPFRPQGFGPYADVLEGLDYVSDGDGLLPRENITHWIREQIEALRSRPFRPQVK